MFVFAADLVAHDLYLQPGAFYLDKPGEVMVEMRITEERFPGDPLRWRGDKTIQLKTLGVSGKKDIPDSDGVNPRITFQKAGTHQIGWEGSVSYISINPEIFDKYITIEGYKDVIEARKKANAQNTFGRERYSRFIKTLVQIGNEKTDDFKRPMGFKIEIIPQTNPVNLKAGDELQVQVLFEGKPLANNRIMATYDEYSTKQEDYAQTLETGPDGMARFKITQPGLWMIRTNRILPVTGDEKADWESFWSNLTFQVR
jgi:hypothetical protein